MQNVLAPELLFTSPSCLNTLPLSVASALEEHEVPASVENGGIQPLLQPVSVKIPIGDRHIVVETGHIGRQASGCVTMTDGETIPPNVLRDCKALHNFSLHDNPITMDQFQQMEGFQEFEGRRNRKFDKQIDSNVMIGSKGLDEGVDL